MKADVTVRPERLDIRACKRPYIALGLVFGLLLYLGVWQATVPGGDWRITLLTGAAFFLTMSWVSTDRIRYSDGQLSYRTLFAGTRSVPLSDIESAATKVISWKGASTVALFIHLRREKAQRPIRIKISFYSKEDLGRLFDLLGPKFKGSRRIGVYTDQTA
jgi:hypothetical protein